MAREKIFATDLDEEPQENEFMKAMDILSERQKTHGDYRETAHHAQRIKIVLREGRNWNDMPVQQRESLDHIATKMARILSGDNKSSDHWDDIGGYAKLGRDA